MFILKKNSYRRIFCVILLMQIPAILSSKIVFTLSVPGPNHDYINPVWCRFPDHPYYLSSSTLCKWILKYLGKDTFVKYLFTFADPTQNMGSTDYVLLKKDGLGFAYEPYDYSSDTIVIESDAVLQERQNIIKEAFRCASINNDTFPIAIQREFFINYRYSGSNCVQKISKDDFEKIRKYLLLSTSISYSQPTWYILEDNPSKHYSIVCLCDLSRPNYVKDREMKIFYGTVITQPSSIIDGIYGSYKKYRRRNERESPFKREGNIVTPNEEIQHFYNFAEKCINEVLSQDWKVVGILPLQYNVP